MLRDLIAPVAVAVAVFWAVVWFIAAPVLGVLWCLTWAVVLALDYHLHRDTAPPVPVVVAERVGEVTLEDERNISAMTSRR